MVAGQALYNADWDAAGNWAGGAADWAGGAAGDVGNWGMGAAGDIGDAVGDFF